MKAYRIQKLYRFNIHPPPPPKALLEKEKLFFFPDSALPHATENTLFH